MTNDTMKTTARRTRRAITVGAGAAGALLLWAVTDRRAGIDLAVHQGDTTQHIDRPPWWRPR